MRRLLLNALAGSGLLLCGLTANAQYAPRDQYGYQQYDQEQNGEHDALFNRLRRDLNRVSANSVPGSGDRIRTDRARQEINELQSRMASGNYDEHDIDRTVMSVERVIDENHMPDWSRNLLSDDLSRLRADAH